jgi:hypothetical protein
MDLRSRIDEDMKAAMRSRDSRRLDAIRMLRAAIQRREVDERTTLDDAAIVAVIEKQIKQGRDSIAQFEAGGRPDLVEHEAAAIEVFEAYLPERLDDDELAALVDQAIAETGATAVRDMGKVMAWLKPRIQGRADMGAVSGAVKTRLSA